MKNEEEGTKKTFIVLYNTLVLLTLVRTQVLTIHGFFVMPSYLAPRLTFMVPISISLLNDDLTPPFDSMTSSTRRTKDNTMRYFQAN